MKTKMLIILTSLTLIQSCTQKDETINLLTQQGYTDIEITGWKPWAASDSDNFATGFKATAPNGVRVKGVVTGGFFKGSTVRFR